MTPRQRQIFAAAAAGVALSRLAALSKSAWDWDEVLFCLALQHFDVSAHQPHPPGFPLYVALGRLARLFVDTDFHALQAVNVLAAMLVFPVVFWLGRSFRFDFHTSVAGGVLFAFLPNVWYHGGTAFSDVPAMVLYMAAIAAYMSAVHAANGTSVRSYLFASLLLAGGMLIRPQNAVVAAFPWTLATVRLLRARRFGAIAGCTLLVVALVGTGYGLAVYYTGFDAYFISLEHHSNFVKQTDSFQNAGRPPLWRVLLRQFDPFEAGKASLALNLLALVALIRGPRRRALEVVLTFVPFFIFALFAVNPAGSSRFSINYMAGVALLTAEGSAVIGRWVAERYQPRYGLALRIGLIAALSLRLATWAAPALEEVRSTVAPPTAAAQWVNEHVPPNAVVFVDESIWPWVLYFAPRHKQLRPGDPAKIIFEADAANGWYVANVPTRARDAVLFVRPQKRIANIVVKRSFESFVPPAASVVHFGAGWYGVEGNAEESWRWAEQLSFVMLGPIAGKAELHLKFSVPVEHLRKPVHVRFTLNSKPIGTVPIPSEETHEVRFAVDARGDAPNLLRIDVSDSFVPAEVGSHDRRELALKLEDWTWRKL